MTQKPPEMPQEIWAAMTPIGKSGHKAGTWSQNPVKINNTGKPVQFDKKERTRYILAAPKEDVERALEALDAIVTAYCMSMGCELDKQSQTYEQKETIRRVLMANAGRGE